MVRSKFRVFTITEYENGNKEVKLNAVTSGSKENEEFFKWTPSGSISLGVINPKAADAFYPGKEFYVDFTPT